MKTLWIVANWKSNKTISESLEWLGVVGPKLQGQENIKIILAPRFSALSELKKEIQTQNYPIILGTQNISPFGTGSYTGEESAQLLKELISVSIIGHCERREKFGETDEVIFEKFKNAKNEGIEPILCIQNPDTKIPEGCKIIAYEPIFAIGTGTPDTPENANEVATAVKAKMPEIEILYGGSVTAQNCTSFISEENIAGLLIGKASLDPFEFLKIIENCAKI